jgi:hypothetical protein
LGIRRPVKVTPHGNGIRVEAAVNKISPFAFAKLAGENARVSREVRENFARNAAEIGRNAVFRAVFAEDFSWH